MTRAGDELRRAIADLFLTAAEAVGQRLRSASLEPTVPFPGSVVERGGSVGVGHWSTSVQIQSINVLRIPQVAARIAPWLSETELTQVGQRSAELADSARETLPFWAVFSGGPLPCSQPLRTLTRFLRLIIQVILLGGSPDSFCCPRCNIISLPSVTDVDEATASSFADEILKVAHDDRIRYRLVVPLNGLALEPSDGRFTAQGVSIRPVSDRERGEWLDERGGISLAFLQSGDFAPPEVAIEFKESSQRNAALENNPGPVCRPSGALQLHGHWVAGRFYRVQSDPPWVVPTLQQSPLTVPGIVEGRSVLTSEGFAITLATARLLAGYGITQPRSPKDLALHRFFAGVARSGASDFLLAGPIVTPRTRCWTSRSHLRRYCCRMTRMLVTGI